jgi:hypothetical protein
MSWLGAAAGYRKSGLPILACFGLSASAVRHLAKNPGFCWPLRGHAKKKVNLHNQS